MISTVVVLPAPFGPSSAKISPALDPERQAVDDGPPAVALAQAVDLDRGRHRPRAVTSRRDQGVLALEVGVGELADLDRAEDPVPVDEVALRPADDAVRRLDRGRPGSTTVGHVAPYCGDERRGPARRDRRSGRRRSRARRRRARPASPRAAGTPSRHGTQDGPQKLMTTGWPRRAARSNGVPSRVVPDDRAAPAPFAIVSPSGRPRIEPATTPTTAVVTAAAMASASRIGPASAWSGRRR